MFTPEELAEISRLLDQAERSGREAAARTLRDALSKMEALAGRVAGPIQRMALFEEVLPVPGSMADPDASGRLRRALERGERVLIRYRANRTGEITTRYIRPFNIHFYDGHEYVEAFCELRGADRIFAIGNIEDILEASGSADRPGGDAAS